MKTFIAALFVTASVSSFACPNLAGEYKSCSATSEMGEVESPVSMTLSQREEGGVTVYSYHSLYSADGSVTSDGEYIADGVTRTQTNDDGSTTTFSARCEGDAVIANADFAMEDGSRGQATINVTKSGDTYVERTTVVVPQVTFTSTITCK